MLPTMYDHYRDQVREIAIRQALADAQREAEAQRENDVVDDAALSA
jgi:hypothetical protein